MFSEFPFYVDLQYDEIFSHFLLLGPVCFVWWFSSPVVGPLVLFCEVVVVPYVVRAVVAVDCDACYCCFVLHVCVPVSILSFILSVATIGNMVATTVCAGVAPSLVG